MKNVITRLSSRAAGEDGSRPAPAAAREHGAAPKSAPESGPERTAPSPGGRIVVGIDDSPGGRAALGWAVSQARTARVPLIAVRSWALGLPRHGGRRRWRAVQVRHPHVVLQFDGFEQRAASAQLISESFQVVAGGIPRDVAVIVQTPEGDPGAVLTDVSAADGDLLVLGWDRGLRLQRLLHGSVSSYCREHARCPVVVVPADPDSAREEAP